jgi:ubiquinone/menaquinone biosynthesis C-methylase UbiE
MAAAEWEPETDNWVQWARTPGFDAYWYFRDAFFADILPPPGARTLEIGCGEGRVARDLVAHGHRVIALDSAVGLVRHARDADREARYLVAGADHLAVPDACVDVVVAYNVLQVVPDMVATVAECARVLRPGGQLCCCIAHPVTDLGAWIDDSDPPQLTIRQPYFVSTRVEDTVEREGMSMTFRGWTHTLEDYSVALHDAGFAIEVIREPKPTPDTRYRRWSEVPLFMNLRAIKRSR